MEKEKFLLLSLKEDKAKKLAQVISNETSRKILDFLAEKEATESQLAKQLNVPISTIHYNLKALIEGGLVIAEEFHYSEKGKEVLHYKLANKYIIIAPKTVHGIKTKLKTILPIALTLAFVSAGIQIFSRFFQKGLYGFTENIAAIAPKAATFGAGAAEAVVEETVADTAPEMMRVAAPAVQEIVNETIPQVIDTVVHEPSFWSNITLWFVLGAVFTLILHFIVEKLRSKNEPPHPKG